MTTKEILLLIAKQSGINAVEVEIVFKAMVSNIAAAVEQGDRVIIRDFGTFTAKRRKSKAGRNIKAGKALIIPERTKPHFKPAALFTEKVNKAAANRKATAL